MMKCIAIHNPGKDSQLQIIECPKPQVKAEEVLIKVHAFAINHADLLQRTGHYPPPKGVSEIPGLEVAGEVVAVGENTHTCQKGDRVYALVSGGGYAEYCVANQKLTKKIPDNMSFITASAIPEALITASSTLFEIGKLQQDQVLLIHGAGSGIASMAVQMAHFTNAKTITTIGDESKRTKAYEMGADLILNYKEVSWYEKIDKDSVHVIVDFIGGEYVNHHLDLLTNKGRLVQIACLNGHRFESSLLPIMVKQLQIQGFILRSQSIHDKSILWRSAHQRWQAPLFAGEIKPIIDSIFQMNAIEKAHQRMSNSLHFGKLVVHVT